MKWMRFLAAVGCSIVCLDGSSVRADSSNPHRVPEGTRRIAKHARVLLLRSYVPANGRLSIDKDLPVVTVVKKDPRTGKTFTSTLPDCPKRITDANAITALFNETRSESTEDLFAALASQLGMNRKGVNPFPYCSWWARINTKVYKSRDYTRKDKPVQDGMDIFLPDSDATYWAIPFNASRKPDSRGRVLEHIEIQGKFKEQLFMSYVLYDSNMDFYYYKNDQGTLCQSYNTDYQIKPDPGSVNPWRTRSTDYNSTYTLKLVFDPKGTDCSGGGPGKHKTTGNNFNVLPLSRTRSGYGPSHQSQVNMLQGDFFGEGASSKVPRSSNGCAYIGADGTPCSLPHMFVAPTDGAQNSVWSNPVAGYLAAGFVAEPGFVYVYRGKAPRVPQGASPVPWRDRRLQDYDMRYYSLCVDKKVWPYPAQDANWSCVNGSFGSGTYNKRTNPDGLTKLMLDEDDYWTVIVSTEDLSDNPHIRNSNANFLRVERGAPVAFILRHMVVQDNFKTSVPFTPRDGAWTSAFDQLEEYYPVETVICNKGQFDKNGWTRGGCYVPPIHQKLKTQ